MKRPRGALVLTVFATAVAACTALTPQSSPSSAVGCAATPPERAVGLAVVDPTTATGVRRGSPDKPGAGFDARWPNPGLTIDDAVAVGSDATLTLRLTDNSGCLGTWQARAVPYFTSPESASGAGIFLGAARSGFKTEGSVHSPPDGDWIVRVDADIGNEPARAWYFRVRVGLATPAPFGSAVTPARPCSTDPPARPPGFTLEARDGASARSTPYGDSWAGQPFGDGRWLDPPNLRVSSGTNLRILVAGDACAIEWSVFYGLVPPAGPGPRTITPVGDLVPPMVNRDPRHAAQNVFELSKLPPGTWMIAAEFGFVHGLALVTWTIVVESPIGSANE